MSERPAHEHVAYYVKTAGVVMCQTCSDSRGTVVMWADAHPDYRESWKP